MHGENLQFKVQTALADDFEHLLMHTTNNLTLLPLIPDFRNQEAIANQFTFCKSVQRIEKRKPWTFIVYMAADNNLRSFAAYNLKQMAMVGSNENVNIIVHLDIVLNGKQKTTRRYFIDKNKIVQVNADDPHSQRMDSGNPQTLISTCQWGIENYHADDYALILWNHGTGILDPIRYGKAINTSDLFSFNPLTNKLDLDRSIPFLDLFDQQDDDLRGICWDDTTGNYLTNSKLEFALNEIVTHILKGKKLSLLGFDACLMSMLEVATITKKYAHIMVSSQEVELGTGWDYNRVLTPFLHGAVEPTVLAKNIVLSYQSAYHSVTNDYTQSAINLNMMHLLEENVHRVGTLLVAALKQQSNGSVKNALRMSRNKNCTHFDEPSYLDLHHFYSNIKANLSHMKLKNESDQKTILAELHKKIDEGIALIQQVVITYTSGSNLRNAKGISIYFPDQKLHSSYPQTSFATSNAWALLVAQYIFS
jgi:hypothetical protein